MRIYIAHPGCGDFGNDDDDDLSLHSTDSQGYDFWVNDETVNLADASNTYVKERGVHDVAAGIVDLTASPQSKPLSRDSVSVSLNNSAIETIIPNERSGEVNQLHRYKTIAKRYKRQFQQKDSQFREQVKQHQFFMRQHAAMKDTLQETSEKLEQLEDIKERHSIETNVANLKIVRLSNETERQKMQIRDLEAKSITLEKELTRLQKNYKRDVENSRSTNMVEVQQVLEEHPKLLNENKRLVNANSNLMAHIQSLEQKFSKTSRTGEKHTAVVAKESTPFHSVVPKRRKLADVAKELQQMEKARLVGPRLLANDEFEERTTSTQYTAPPKSSKYSAVTRRIAGATQHKGIRRSFGNATIQRPGMAQQLGSGIEKTTGDPRRFDAALLTPR